MCSALSGSRRYRPRHTRFTRRRGADAASMMRFPDARRRRFWVVVATIGVSAVVVAILLGHHSILRLEAAHGWIAHSRDVLRSIERLRGHVNTIHFAHRAALVEDSRALVERR